MNTVDDVVEQMNMGMTCIVCGTTHMDAYDEYPHLHDEDPIPCNCGEILCTKKDLYRRQT